MDLVAYVGNDKENWGQITALINHMECDKVVLITTENTKTFPVTSKCEVIEVDASKPLLELKKTLMEKIKQKIGLDFEVALSLASGTGKEHMALISALLSIPVGIRLVVYTKQGVEIIN